MSARDDMLAKRAELLAEHQHIVTAAELAPHMGEHQREYWNWCLERVVGSCGATEETQHG